MIGGSGSPPAGPRLSEEGGSRSCSVCSRPTRPGRPDPPRRAGKEHSAAARHRRSGSGTRQTRPTARRHTKPSRGRGRKRQAGRPRTPRLPASCGPAAAAGPGCRRCRRRCPAQSAPGSCPARVRCTRRRRFEPPPPPSRTASSARGRTRPSAPAPPADPNQRELNPRSKAKPCLPLQNGSPEHVFRCSVSRAGVMKICPSLSARVAADKHRRRPSRRRSHPTGEQCER